MSERLPEDSKSKIVYIDHIRVALTVLVILHHAAVTYGAPGGWYYFQKSTLLAFVVPVTAFVAVNQAFFMGFFFFLSALFVPGSFDRKGPARFITDRLLRLGIPLVFYSLVLSPFLSYMVYYGAKGNRITYRQYLGGFTGWIDFGVLWFVAALLLFTVSYALYRMLITQSPAGRKFPSNAQILLFAAAIGFVSFLARIVFPVGWVLEPLGFQLGHFPQYISMYILGLVAAGNNWLTDVRYEQGIQMRRLSRYLVFLGLPMFFIARRLLDFPIGYYSGGPEWQSLWYAVWEQMVGFTIVTALLCIGKNRWNKPSVLMAKLARTTFAAYIFHPLVLVAFSVSLHHWAVDPALKFLIVAPAAVLSTFFLAHWLVKVPVINKII